jgi:hypothetical protein
VAWSGSGMAATMLHTTPVVHEASVSSDLMGLLVMQKRRSSP